MTWDPTLVTVAVGTGAVGGLAGAVGTFAVVRRQSLLGDAVSHAALPGLGVAYLLGARSPAGLAAGGAVAGWLGLLIVSRLVGRRRVSFDAALGGMLAVFFGLGLALLGYIQRHIPGANKSGFERYLFGQAATLTPADVGTVLVAAGVLLPLVAAVWKPWKLIAFDPTAAAVQGWPVGRLEHLFTAVLVIAVVVGLQAVGVVLMSALLVAPAVAARPWVRHLGEQTVLAGVFGVLAGVAGTLVSHALSDSGRTVPTGPTIVLCAIAIVAVAFGAARLRRRRANHA